MTQPTAYTPAFNFTSFSASYPSSQQPGVSLDGEFNALKATTDGVLASIKLIQRDDGRLANGSVGLDQCGADVLLVLGKTWLVRGLWLTATSYAVGDVVSTAGTTYVCSTVHVSGTFATDLAAGKWVAVFSTSGVTPSDGTVTSAKIVDGAVTLSKVGFTSLDLATTIRAQTGLAAGTATPGSYTIAGAIAAGNAYLSIARATQAQGIVGVRFDGGTSGQVVEIRQAASANDLHVYSGALGTDWMTFAAAGPMDALYTLRATGTGTPATGAGVEISYAASIGYVNSYNRTGAAATQLNLQGSQVWTVAGGVAVAKASSTGVDFPLVLTKGGVNVGYLGAPVNTQAGSYTLAIADCGKRILSTNAGATTVNIPTFASIAIPVDDGIFMVINDGTTAMTIAPAGGVTLKFAGSVSTGNRTLGVNGVASLMKTKTDEWFISGAGVT